jgi:hypothetical protein
MNSTVFKVVTPIRWEAIQVFGGTILFCLEGPIIPTINQHKETEN